VWLAPEQVRVLGISEKVTEYAEEVRAALFAAGVRVRLDMGAEKIGAKIRLAQLAKVPYMLVVGAKEAESRTLSIRSRRHGDLGVLSLSEFLDHLLPEIRERTS
jgi:threonyl-tRNA synthetase